MKKRLWVGLVAGLFLAGMVGVVQATVIVDTGSNNTGTNWLLSSDQWLAAEFTIDQGQIITDLEGWLGNFNAGGTLTGAIYSDGGEFPGTELYSAQFTAENIDNWNGLHNQNWSLVAGTYWASFEVRLGDGDTFDGTMPGVAAIPLVNEAYTYQGNWHEWDSLKLGVRISADKKAPVPEPATMLLFGTGLVGIVGLRSRKSKK